MVVALLICDQVGKVAKSHGLAVRLTDLYRYLTDLYRYLTDLSRETMFHLAQPFIFYINRLTFNTFYKINLFVYRSSLLNGGSRF